MEIAKRQINYFESLENAIKTAFSVYVIVFCAGAILLLSDPQMLLTYVEQSRIEIPIMIVLILLGVFFGIFYLIGKVHWLSNIHIEIDHKIFGFLQKSNEIIYATLITSLTPEERQVAERIPSKGRAVITQSVFSSMSKNIAIFHALMKSGVFRTWMRYWMALYGTITFAVLTLGAFISEVIKQPESGKTLFTIMWVMTLLHLLVGIYLGNYLLRKTKGIMEHVVHLDGAEIAHRLRTFAGVEEKQTDDVHVSQAAEH